MNGITMPGSEIKAIGKVCKIFHIPTCFTAASRMDKNHIIIIQNTDRIGSEQIPIAIPNINVPKIKNADNVQIEYTDESAIFTINDDVVIVDYESIELDSEQKLNNTVNGIIDCSSSWNWITVDSTKFMKIAEQIPKNETVKLHITDKKIEISQYGSDYIGTLAATFDDIFQIQFDTVVLLDIDYVTKILKCCKAHSEITIGVINGFNGMSNYPVRFVTNVNGHTFDMILAPRIMND